LRQCSFQLGKFIVEHSHVKPFVHAREEHSPNVYGPCQQCKLGGDEHLDRHQQRDRGHDDKKYCPVKVESPPRPFRRVTRRKHADRPESNVRKREKITIIILHVSG